MNYLFKDTTKWRSRSEETLKRKTVQKALEELKKREDEYKKIHEQEQLEKIEIAKKKKADSVKNTRKNLMNANR